MQAAVISGLGLSVFALSTFTPTQRFGYLMLTILFAGLVAELIMLPALLAGPLGRFCNPRPSRKAKAKLAGIPATEPSSADIPPTDAQAQAPANDGFAQPHITGEALPACQSPCGGTTADTTPAGGNAAEFWSAATCRRFLFFRTGIPDENIDDKKILPAKAEFFPFFCHQFFCLLERNQDQLSFQSVLPFCQPTTSPNRTMNTDSPDNRLNPYTASSEIPPRGAASLSRPLVPGDRGPGLDRPAPVPQPGPGSGHGSGEPERDHVRVGIGRRHHAGRLVPRLQRLRARTSRGRRGSGPVGAAAITSVRIEQVSGDLVPRLAFRWQPHADQRLAKPMAGTAAVDLQTTTPDDFPSFSARGATPG